MGIFHNQNKKITKICLCLFLAFSTAFGNILLSSADSQINILDYYAEGIPADYTEYFTIWNQGSNVYPLQINATVLEFVGSTGWPELKLELWDWDDFKGGMVSTDKNETNLDYFVRCQFTCEAESRYVLAVTNLDPVDDCTYNLTFWTQAPINFVYTEKYDISGGDLDVDDLTTITYFGDADPSLYALLGEGTSRIVVDIPYAQYQYVPLYEHYFLIENTGDDSLVFLGFVGEGSYLDSTPQITGYLQDWENYDEGETTDQTFFTIVNDSTGFWFNCLAGHKYSLWVKGGTELNPIDLYVIVESFGNTKLYFEDGSNDPPKEVIEIIPTREDPWITSRNLRRWIIFGGAGGAILGLSAIGWWIKRRF